MPQEIVIPDPPPADHRIPYGPDRFQFGDLRLPAGNGPHPAAIVIHGGYWRSLYGLDYIGHICTAFAGSGLATWSLEYRRIGNPGGGWPGTFQDVADGAVHVKSIAGSFHLDLDRIIVVGHSAGGHLALWLGTQKRMPLRGIVSLAGVADLRRAWELKLSNNVVRELLGGSPEEVPDRYDAASPMESLPLGIPQRLFHGTQDTSVPFEISERYIRKAQSLGDDAELITLENSGHFEIVDPRTREFERVRKSAMVLALGEKPA